MVSSVDIFDKCIFGHSKKKNIQLLQQATEQSTISLNFNPPFTDESEILQFGSVQIKMRQIVKCSYFTFLKV